MDVMNTYRFLSVSITVAIRAKNAVAKKSIPRSLECKLENEMVMMVDATEQAIDVKNANVTLYSWTVAVDTYHQKDEALVKYLEATIEHQVQENHTGYGVYCVRADIYRE